MNILEIEKKACTGCMACSSVCPVHCIMSRYDPEGFAYPVIDEVKCIDCSKCVKTCPYDNKTELFATRTTYAVQAKDWDNLKNSASGGIAFELCRQAILDGGVAYGAIYDESLRVHHARAETIQQLQAQQGSKYVQSDFSSIYSQVKEDCIKGRGVVVVGTPCQIAGLRNFLNHDYTNLLLVDLICHGVPSQKLFDKYLGWKSKQLRVDRINDYRFRDKAKGWGTTFKVIADNKIQYGGAMEEPYYADFEFARSYRESCYQCQYACPERTGDITVGDYWNFFKFHPKSLVDTTKGVSCVLVNTQRGEDALNGTSSRLQIILSTVEKVNACNSSLTGPAHKPDIREQFYRHIDAEGFDWSQKRIKKTRAYYKSWIVRHVPKSVKKALKKMKGRMKK